MIKAVIFDCFGVIYDDNFDEVWVRLGGDLERDRKFMQKTFHDSHVGNIDSSATVFSKFFGITEEEFRQANDGARDIKHDVLAYSDSLRKNYKVGMLSNIGSAGLSKYIPDEVLAEHFDVVVQSSQIGYAKPEAQAYEITADRLGVRLDECVFIDDRQEYVDGASGVGMKAILFTNLDKLKRDLHAILGE